MKYKITTIIISFLLILPATVLAQGLREAAWNLDIAANNQTTGLERDLSSTIGLVVKGALALVGTIFLLLTIYAGILWMTASGKEEQIETAQKIIKATIIGLFITMAAYAITFFVTSRLSGAGTGASAPGGGKTKLQSCVNDLKGKCFSGPCVPPEKTKLDTDCWNEDLQKSQVCCY